MSAPLTATLAELVGQEVFIETIRVEHTRNTGAVVYRYDRHAAVTEYDGHDATRAWSNARTAQRLLREGGVMVGSTLYSPDCQVTYRPAAPADDDRAALVAARRAERKANR